MSNKSITFAIDKNDKPFLVMKKSDLKIMVTSVLVVVVAMAVCFIESFFLVKNGLSFDVAFLTSLYTGFLAVVVLFTVVISTGDWFYNFIEK